MKLLTSFCSTGVGCSGYVAAIECSNVQELRPSCTTSGGQSAGAAVGVVPVWALSADLLLEVKAANELHDRHLTVQMAWLDQRLLSRDFKKG
jgi:hypothetical protein